MRRIFSIALIAILIFVLSASVGNKANAEEELSQEAQKVLNDSKELSLLHRHAANANDKIMNSFPFDENGMWIYPDYFAGTYIDGEYLILCLKNADSDVVSNYLSIAGGEAAYVKIRDVVYSCNELQKIADNVASNIKKNGVSIHYYCFDASINGLKFAVSADDICYVQTMFKRCYPDIPVQVVPAQPFEFTSVFL